MLLSFVVDCMVTIHWSRLSLPSSWMPLQFLFHCSFVVIFFLIFLLPFFAHFLFSLTLSVPDCVNHMKWRDSNAMQYFFLYVHMNHISMHNFYFSTISMLKHSVSFMCRMYCVLYNSSTCMRILLDLLWLSAPTWERRVKNFATTCPFMRSQNVEKKMKTVI